MTSATYRVSIASTRLFITIGREGGSVKHIFIHSHSPNAVLQSTVKALAAMIYVAIDSGASVERIIRHLKGISNGECSWDDGVRYDSIPDAIAKTLEISEAGK